MNTTETVCRAVRFADESGEGIWRTINGSPVFIKEGQSIKDAVAAKFGKIDSKEFVYHTTSPAAIRGIAKKGLLPRAGQYGRGVYFAPNIAKTGGYGSAEGAIIRARRDTLPKDFQEWPGEQGWTETTISSKDLEVSVDGGKSWKKVKG